MWMPGLLRLQKKENGSSLTSYCVEEAALIDMELKQLSHSFSDTNKDNLKQIYLDQQTEKLSNPIYS